MLNLSEVTLFCVETRDPNLAHWAIDQCLSKVNFAKVVLLTDLRLLNEKKSGISYFQAPPIKTTKDYSDFLLTSVGDYVLGTHVLIIQWDSFVTNPELWQQQFLEYDYIGPVWPHHPENPVGNGGFSLRSKKLLEALKSPLISKHHPEDYCICADNKAVLEKKFNIRFAPVSVAEVFAVERSAWHSAFGFHGFFNFGRVLPESKLQQILKIIPDSYLQGVDTFDLIDCLVSINKLHLALELSRHISFSWKFRGRFMLMKLKLFVKKLRYV